MRGAHDALPTVTFVVPVPPGFAPPLALPQLERLDYAAARVEILLVEGSNPSRQRNVAAAAARGELLYYIDNDSLLDADALTRALECLVDHPLAERVAGVGGPVLALASDTTFQKAASAALGSMFGLGPFRSRYASRGDLRQSGEAELISANLVVRRAAVANGNHFDERLYPNEENELLNRLSSSGALLFHHPQMVCRRSQRETLGAVLHQHLRYGRGRARHIAIDRRGFRPALVLPVALLVAFVAAALTGSIVLAIAPLGYALVMMIAAAAIARRSEKPPGTFVALLGIFPAMHLGYGAGMLWEFAQRLMGRHTHLGEAGGDAVTIRVVQSLACGVADSDEL